MLVVGQAGVRLLMLAAVAVGQAGGILEALPTMIMLGEVVVAVVAVGATLVVVAVARHLMTHVLNAAVAGHAGGVAVETLAGLVPVSNAIKKGTCLANVHKETLAVVIAVQWSASTAKVKAICRATAQSQRESADLQNAITVSKRVTLGATALKKALAAAPAGQWNVSTAKVKVTCQTTAQNLGESEVQWNVSTATKRATSQVTALNPAESVNPADQWSVSTATKRATSQTTVPNPVKSVNLADQW
jgi:hypothetical protein